MAKITGIIPQRGFEIILKRIAFIILDELTAQKTAQNIEADFSVYTERQKQYDKSEDIVISVALNTAGRSNKDQREVQSNSTYFIDFFTSGIEAAGKTGDEDSRAKLHLFMGMVDYILSTTIYKTLDFEPGLIGSTMVESLQMDDNYGNQDGAFIRFGRITYTVSHKEKQQMWGGIPLAGNDTVIKYENTDFGIKLTFDN